MRLKKIKILTYNYGEEEELKNILYKSKEPLLIRINGFTDEFTLDYFQKKNHGSAVYSIFDNYRVVDHKSGDLREVLEEIKNNKPYRIFGQIFARKSSSLIEEHVPLWQSIPFSPRFYAARLKVAYFFGGRGSATDLHFDREHCCNLHLCMSGRKQLLLFTEDQSDYLYKVPYIGDALVNFSQPIEQLQQNYPRLNQALGYHVILKTGDMLFMPRNCWHYTRYLDASTSATYIFYTNKLLQFYGYFTGYFFIGYNWDTLPFKIAEWPLFKKFSDVYAKSAGWKKYLLKAIEQLSYIFLLPIISIGVVVFIKIKTLIKLANRE